MSDALSIRETTEALTRLAEAAEEWATYGIRPHLHLPAALVAAAEKIVLAAQTPRTTAWIRGTSVGQIVTMVSEPGETVTAPMLRDRISRAGREVTVRAVSTALFRAAERGQFERMERGVYRRAAPSPLGPEQPADVLPVSETEGGRGDEAARRDHTEMAMS